MKQIIIDVKDELEQNLDLAAETVKKEPKKIFQSIKTAITGKTSPPGSSIGSSMADPLVSDKPAPSKKMMTKISDMTTAIALKRQEDLRKRFAQIRNEAINPENKENAQVGSQKAGPEVKAGPKKLTPIQQSIKNASTSTESKDTGAMG